jgi:basic amino acid/polyamine antiporter, APA family
MARHTIWSGAGLVIANMIGVGVMISTGFMAQDMGPIPILLAWAVGAGIAFCGVLAYSGLALQISESGGEYRFLSDLVHPFLGYLAGWGSLILGFSAAIAADAYAVGSYVNTLIDGPDPRLVGAAVVLVFVLVHAGRGQLGFVGQNGLVAAKVAFLAVFVVLGLALGSNAMPTWAPPSSDDHFPLRELIMNQFWIAFAFSGWNAAAYVAREFRNPTRDVGRAMIVGMGSVAVLYLLINWIFVANLTPAEAQAVFTYEQSRISLAHLVAQQLFGAAGGAAVSLFVILALVSAISAMMMVGPRVYAAMAGDGYLPRVFAAPTGTPRFASVMLQGSVVLIFLIFHGLRETVQAASAFLMVFSALTALSLFRLGRIREGARPARLLLVAAVVHAAAVACILATGLQTSWALWSSLSAVFILATIGYVAARRIRPPWRSREAVAQPAPGSTVSVTGRAETP